ncbi:MAG: hypothetical protein JKY82_03720 [Rhizobiaceae bacterium]|nr:hypothetical protein [Rhizobiaceae bacterium]
MGLPHRIKALLHIIQHRIGKSSYWPGATNGIFNPMGIALSLLCQKIIKLRAHSTHISIQISQCFVKIIRGEENHTLQERTFLQTG